MGVSKASEVKSSRKRKNDLENGQDKPKELECTEKPSTVKGKKKEKSKAKEKPLQENIISSSLEQEAVDGNSLGSSLWNGIQAEEGAAPSEETKATSPQGPAVGLEGPSRSQDQSQGTGPAVGEQHLETQNGIGVPSEGVAGGVASPSGDPLERDVGLTAVRESEEKQLDPPIPQQEEDSQAPERKRGKKQEENKQERGFKRKGGRKHEKNKQGKGLKRKGGKKHENNKQEMRLKRKRGRKDKFEDLMDGIEEEDEGRNWEGGWGRAKKQRSNSSQGWDEGKRKREKGKAKKPSRGKVKRVEKVGKRKIKKEKLLKEEQEMEKDEEGEKGVGSEEQRVGKGSGSGKGVEKEEEVDEKGNEGLGEGRSSEMGQEVKEEKDEGKGDTQVEEKKKKKKKKKPEVETEEMEKKSEEEETPGKTGKRKSKEGEEKKEEEKNNKKTKKQKEEEKEAENKWKWWEEEKKEDGIKWMQLEHRGPYFVPPYEPLPKDVQFYYDGKPLKLSLATEEIATFYAKMLDHEYTTKEIFQNNFFHDWRKEMTSEEQEIIKDLDKCDFGEIHKYFVDKNEARKALPKEEKQKLKEEADKIQEEYGYCILDGHREKIGNFKTEPPGLFRGRGEHPKMGMLKKRIMPEDVVINCSKDSKIPEPPEGHKWKEVRFDNTVTWLASWTENIQNTLKYIMLNPSSKLKGEKDWQKYEVARRLKDVVHTIRAQYRKDWKSKEIKKRQRAVALYFIDKLALRAGNEKEEGETADTVGCCSLRVEHIQLHPQLDGQEHVVEFDFLGKDSIRYYNKVSVEKPVFKNLQLFMKNKDPSDDLFEHLNTTFLNKHLQDLMDGLTAKVFRTYNASITLQEQLKALTNPEDNVAGKLLSYNRANRAVAILCNHQRSIPKTFARSMQVLQEKIDAKKKQVEEAQEEVKKAEDEFKDTKEAKAEVNVEKKKKLLKRLEEQLARMNIQATDKEENKQIALGTSKLNYLDPRITVAWCKKFGIPIEKVYNKTQREKFAWAIDMAGEDFEF
ncbi:DNA topoisomerase I, mitochondrial isoform X2 [Ammospiza nelsoni]|uniref:DNA topoisomerase I, mitochondrial isoform X1 n=1 Tax=Ammospiza caudacuta TaxID=2857398 RepID=UPI00273A0FE9|nr:DNA topoisomerase I, mitochondrial isoform X1 [Ammospiza caudacuta]XP_059334810.1 DNA topoisomerase I, mitochondrial isoform X2 [Ammospiza nelsoni]